MPEYLKRLLGDSALPEGHRIVRLLATEREQLGPKRSFVYVYIVVVEADPDDDE